MVLIREIGSFLQSSGFNFLLVGVKFLTIKQQPTSGQTDLGAPERLEEQFG